MIYLREERQIMKCEMEIARKIYNDMDKYCYEVSPDPDGLNCVQVCCRDENGKPIERIIYSPEIAVLVAEAIKLCVKEIEQNKPLDL